MEEGGGGGGDWMAFWTKLLKSPSLPTVLLAMVVAVLEAALDDE